MNQTKTKAPVKKGWAKYLNKELFAFLVSAILAAASVFLIGPWIDEVMLLSTQAIAYNFLAAASALAMYFVAKTHYSRGMWNVLKKIFWVVVLASAVIGFSLLSTTAMGGAASIGALVYPLTGIFIVSVIFYMVSLSSETIGLIGMSFLSVILLGIIAGAAFYGHLQYAGVILAIKAALLIILSAGGVFAKLRMYLHGIRGVNNDGGFGDSGDGDGDTGDE